MPRILQVALMGVLVAASASAQVTMSTNSIADAFVRSLGSNVSSNFGGAGALEVSGTIATNNTGVQQGAFDSFLRFNISSMAATFNTSFGAGSWTITNANLKVTEVGAPSNAIFNRGVGQFEVQWIAIDAWLEGTGMPNAPTTYGIVWADESAVLSDGQASLGTFSNAGADGLRTFSLSLPASFLNDLLAGGLVSVYMTATPGSTVGFNFNSRNFGTASAQPFLELTAVAIPEPSTICLLTLSVAALAVMRRRRSR